jgi:hypothetical protein
VWRRSSLCSGAAQFTEQREVFLLAGV